jgi:hypothetical protein
MALTTIQTLACLQLMGKDETLALGAYAQQNNITLQSSPDVIEIMMKSIKDKANLYLLD